MTKINKNRNNSIHAYNQLKESNNKKKKVILGLSVIALLSVLSTAGLLVFNNSGVSASNKTEEIQKIEDLQQSNTELSELIEKMEANKKELEAQIVNLSNDKNLLSSEVSELKETIKVNQASINSLTNQVSILDGQISAVRQEKISLEQQIDVLESQSIIDNEVIVNLRAELTNKNSELISLNTQKSELESAILSNNVEISNLQNQIYSYQAEIENLDNVIANLTQGQSTIRIDNPEITITRNEYSVIEGYTDDVLSLDANGNEIPFKVVAPENWGTGTMEVYYFNGNGENGDYAIRIVHIVEGETLRVIHQGNELTSKYQILEEETTISYDDYQFISNSSLFNPGEVFDDGSIVIYKYRNGEYIENSRLDKSGDTYTFEMGYTYEVMHRKHITIQNNGFFSGFEFAYDLQVNASGNPARFVSSSDGSAVATSANLNEQGEFVVTFNAFGYSDAQMTVRANAIKRVAESNHLGSVMESECSLSEGFAIQNTSGGSDGRGEFLSFTITHVDGHELTMEFDSEYIKYRYNEWKQNGSSENLGVAVSSVVYFENGKGFDDTPEVTNIYEENGYAVFEFNAFGQTSNKAYLEIGSAGEGYVELSNGDQDAVLSIVQQNENEIILCIGYHLPGTQLYITIVPTE